MPQNMVCQRDFVLRTKLGHVIRFEANKPTIVPDEAVDAALAVNIIPVEGGFVKRQNGDRTIGPIRMASMSPEMREAVLLHTIDELVRDNEASAFDAGGKPKVNIIRDRCGLEITATERSRLWDKYRELIANNVGLPSPRNVRLVMEVQAATAHASIMEYLKLFGVNADEVRGYTLKELKARAVREAIAFNDIADTGDGSAPPADEVEALAAATLDDND